jgi:hypothetical protein
VTDAERLAEAKRELEAALHADIHAPEASWYQIQWLIQQIDERDATIAMLQTMADAAEKWYWAENRAYLDTVGSKERVFDALRLLGRYPPPAIGDR